MGSKRAFQATLRNGLEYSRAETAFTVPRALTVAALESIFISMGGPQAHRHSE